MRKYILLIVVLLQGTLGFGQAGGKETYLPNYIPPSPTVAALMRFEEVPVDNYTGIPDVSIPIFSSSAKDKKLEINISLKYHPSGVAVDAMAGDAGVGWSLFAGGTISRIVRDLPDEMLIYERKIGIYHSINNYYNVVNLLENGIQDSINQYVVDEFMWEANEKNQYDTQHDLWQFNFMGYSGRFYIKKNVSTGILEVVPLENYNLKIINHYNTVNNYPTNPKYKPMSFEVIDTQGYKYFFEEYDETKASPFSSSHYYPYYDIVTQADPQIQEYKSAFHLTKITSMNDKVLVELSYTNGFNEDNNIGNRIEHHPLFDPQDMLSEFYGILPCNLCPDGGENAITKLEPTAIQSVNDNLGKVRKLQDIIITGVAKIHFAFETGRLDSYYGSNTKGCKLTEISIRNWKDKPVRKYKFNYNYVALMKKRLFLTGIDFQDNNNDTVYNYGFEYEENAATYIGRDYWGYYNVTSPCKNYDRYKEVTPSFCTSEVLQKIKLPTGGCQIFDFEPNDFSYIGSTALTEFDENVNNIEAEIVNDFWSSSLESTSMGAEEFVSIGTFNNDTILMLHSSIDQNQGIAGFLKLYKKLPNQPKVLVTILSDCPQQFTFGGGYEYIVGFIWNRYTQIGDNPVAVEDLPNRGSAFVYADMIPRSPGQKKLAFGGGIRIHKIGYFDNDMTKEYYRVSHDVYPPYSLPAKEIIYSYRLKDDSMQSSGALVFPKPIFSYVKEVMTCMDCSPYLGNTQLRYTTDTNFNNLLAGKSRGSDVGYKNVSISETGNGRTEFEYTTSIDNPELSTEYNVVPPFLPLESYDFKRGLLLNHETFDNTGRVLAKTVNQYEVDQYTQTTGLNVFNRPENKFTNSYKYANFNIFCTYKALCKSRANYEFNCINFSQGLNPSVPQCPCHCYSGEEVSDVIFSVPLLEHYGWVKLLSSNTKNYFYDAGNNQRIVEKNDLYEYNDLNRKIAVKTESTSQTDAILTKYYYPKDTAMSGEPHVGELISNNIIETPLVTEVYRGATKLSEQRTLYNNWGNLLLLPEIIQVSKGTASLENRARFIQYDDLGHPLEMKTENGTIISYIWGYEKSQPIAKLENLPYSSVSSLVNSLQTLSNADDDHCTSFPCTGDEENLRTALKSLRTSFPDALITTFTYDPLVGVTSVTDPKGYTTYYDYDNLGRLSAVKDANGNKLSENQYHYRP